MLSRDERRRGWGGDVGVWGECVGEGLRVIRLEVRGGARVRGQVFCSNRRRRCRRRRTGRVVSAAVCTRSRHAAVVRVFVCVVVAVRRRLRVRRRRRRGGRGRAVPVGQHVGGRAAGRPQVRQGRVDRRRRDRRGRAGVRGLRGVPRAGPHPRLRGLGLRGPRGAGPVPGGRAARVGRRRDRRRTHTGECARRVSCPPISSYPRDPVVADLSVSAGFQPAFANKKKKSIRAHTFSDA